jgi:hypothetical protein
MPPTVVLNAAPMSVDQRAERCDDGHTGNAGDGHHDAYPAGDACRNTPRNGPGPA